MEKEGQTKVFVHPNLAWIYYTLEEDEGYEIQIYEGRSSDQAKWIRDHGSNQFAILLPMEIVLIILDKSPPPIITIYPVLEYEIRPNVTCQRIPKKVDYNYDPVDGWSWKKPWPNPLVVEINSLRDELMDSQQSIIHSAIVLMGTLCKSRLASRDMIKMMGQIFYEVAIEEARNNL